MTLDLDTDTPHHSHIFMWKFSHRCGICSAIFCFSRKSCCLLRLHFWWIRSPQVTIWVMGLLAGKNQKKHNVERGENIWFGTTHSLPNTWTSQVSTVSSEHARLLFKHAFLQSEAWGRLKHCATEVERNLARQRQCQVAGRPLLYIHCMNVIATRQKYHASETIPVRAAPTQNGKKLNKYHSEFNNTCTERMGKKMKSQPQKFDRSSVSTPLRILFFLFLRGDGSGECDCDDDEVVE